MVILVVTGLYAFILNKYKVFILLKLKQTFYIVIITEIERKYCLHMRSQFDGVGVVKYIYEFNKV